MLYTQSGQCQTLHGRVLTVAVHLVHIFWWNSNDAALLNDFGIFPDYSFYDLEIFHSDLDDWSAGAGTTMV